MILAALSGGQLMAQQTVFTVDESFDTGMIFRACPSVTSFLHRPDGSLIVGGGFEISGLNWEQNSIKGFGVVNDDGSWNNNWGGLKYTSARKMGAFGNDHFVYVGYGHHQRIMASTWDMPALWTLETYSYFEPYELLSSDPNQKYQSRGTADYNIMDDGSLICAGALTTDTTQQDVWRHVYKFHGDGTLDTDFPVVEADPNNHPHVVGQRLVKLSDGRWIMSGRFSGVNGHHSPHLVRFTADFEIDTTFVSPFGYRLSPEPMILLLDSEDHLWMRVTGTMAADGEEIPYSLLRLNSDGELSENFVPGIVSTIPGESELYAPGHTHLFGMIVDNVVELDEEENFLIVGRFKTYNDTLALGITVVNKYGHLRNEFFGHQGGEFNVCRPGSIHLPHFPQVRAVLVGEDGSLILGGGFSDFMGHERYNVVKLNRGSVNTANREAKRDLRIFPNPATDAFRIDLPQGNDALLELNVYDMSGRLVRQVLRPQPGIDVNVGDLKPGMYIVRALSAGEAYEAKLVLTGN